MEKKAKDKKVKKETKPSTERPEAASLKEPKSSELETPAKNKSKQREPDSVLKSMPKKDKAKYFRRHQKLDDRDSRPLNQLITQGCVETCLDFVVMSCCFY